MGEVCTFVGVQPAPGVAQACFSGERERFGPADHKIWATSAISRGSVGSGELVPAGLILPQITTEVNKLAGKLGYLPIAADWGTPGRPCDPRTPDTIRSPAPPPRGQTEAGPLPEVLRSRVANAGEQFASQ
jgi:hypothetical protein